MDEPELTLLDGVRWHGRPVPGPRSAALLAALALTAPRALGVRGLVAEVWEDEPPEHPEKALQVLVSRTRARTAPEVVESSATGYRLGLPADRVDLLCLRALVSGATDEAGLEAALALPLSGADGDSPPGRAVAEARRLRSEAQRTLGARLLGRGDAARALALLEAVVAVRPGDEAVLADVLRCEAEVRGVPTALARYAEHAERVRDTLGAEPGEQLRRLHADLLARDAPVREGLEYDASPMVGREHDLGELRALMDTSRVVSIVGAGGLGKTRMAHLAGRATDHPVVHFVGLAGVATQDGVLPEVASALGVRDTITGLGRQRNVRPGELRGRIAEQLSGPRTLLILDNCEHVLDAAADLVAFLVAATGSVRVLTTSRAPLGVAAERVYPLPQLDLAASVELFTQRARAARPDVTLASSEVTALVDRLDGLPLAIELAAARVRVMSVAEITRRLADRFALLRGGDRSAPERHQTLLAVIDWSWNLLRDQDRRALRWLSVFPDGFGLAGAEALLGHDPLDEITRLVDQSLLNVHEVGPVVRYRMLETVREYAGRRLSEAGEEAAAEVALRAWAVELARREGARAYSAHQLSAVAALATEEGNLTGLLRRAVDEQDVPTVLALGATLTGLWSLRGEHLAVVETSREIAHLVVTAEATEETEDELRAVLTMIVLNGLIFAGQPQQAAQARLRDLGPGRGPRRIRAMVRVLLAVADDDSARLRELCDDADPMTAMAACQFLSQILENHGDLEGSRALLERALAFDVPDDGPWAEAQLDAMMSGLAAQAGDVERAETHALRALPVMEALGAVEDAVQLRWAVFSAQLERGAPDSAERVLDEIDRLEGAHETISWWLVNRVCQAELLLARGRVRAGLAQYRDAVEKNRTSRRPWVTLDVELTPWLLFTESACLAAHVLHDPGGQDTELCRPLRAKVPALVESPEGRRDFPIAGGVLFALGCWAVAHDEPRTGVRLLLVARAFGYQQTMPSMRWERAERLAEEHAPGRLAELWSTYDGIATPELCDEARALAARLSPE